MYLIIKSILIYCGYKFRKCLNVFMSSFFWEVVVIGIFINLENIDIFLFSVFINYIC